MILYAMTCYLYLNNSEKKNMTRYYNYFCIRVETFLFFFSLFLILLKRLFYFKRTLSWNREVLFYFRTGFALTWKDKRFILSPTIFPTKSILHTTKAHKALLPLNTVVFISQKAQKNCDCFFDIVSMHLLLKQIYVVQYGMCKKYLICYQF